MSDVRSAVLLSIHHARERRPSPPAAASRALAVAVAVLALLSACKEPRKPAPNPAVLRKAAAALTSAQTAWVGAEPAARKPLDPEVNAYRKASLEAGLTPQSGFDPAPIEAWHERVLAVHKQADAARSRETRERAVEALRSLAREQAPRGVTPEDAARLRHDLYLRCARLAYDLERFEDAAVIANQGLFISARDPMRVQLLIMLGQARRATGDPSGEERVMLLARKDLSVAAK
jgi:hypothetical protein